MPVFAPHGRGGRVLRRRGRRQEVIELDNSSHGSRAFSTAAFNFSKVAIALLASSSDGVVCAMTPGGT